jgi:hypothetical protein
MSYKTDWRDKVRHIANMCFVLSYLNFENGHIAIAACCTLVGELLITPSALKHRSWSTVAVSAVFMVLALSTVYRYLS